jgi:hypothetical protein
MSPATSAASAITRQESNREFAGQVPADLLTAAQTAGTWTAVFGADADEVFQAYHQAKYINEIAAAGKQEFAIPCYINVMDRLPGCGVAAAAVGHAGHRLSKRRRGAETGSLMAKTGALNRHDRPGHLCRRLVSFTARHQCLSSPGQSALDSGDWPRDSFAKFFFYALGDGAIGFSPFGVDQTGWNILGDQPWKAHARNFSIIGPMSREIAQLEFEGKLKTAVEEPGKATEEVDFGGWQATVAYGFPQPDGRRAPGTKDAHGAALMAQLGPDEFLVTGVDASVSFHLPWKAAVDSQPDSHCRAGHLRERRVEAIAAVEWR